MMMMTHLYFEGRVWLVQNILVIKQRDLEILCDLARYNGSVNDRAQFEGDSEMCHLQVAYYVKLIVSTLDMYANSSAAFKQLGDASGHHLLASNGLVRWTINQSEWRQRTGDAADARRWRPLDSVMDSFSSVVVGAKAKTQMSPHETTQGQSQKQLGYLLQAAAGLARIWLATD